MKRCSKCGKRKPVADFNKSSRHSGGLQSHCRECQKVTRHAWYAVNTNAERRKSAAYSKSEKAREARKIRYAKHRKRLLESNRQRRRTVAARAKANIRQSFRRLSDASFRLACNLRVRIRKSLIGVSKSAATLRLIGCDLETLKRWIESQFEGGMSWENYGYFGWHIDHARPCKSFDLRDPALQRACFYYTNLRPMWRFDNQSKGCKTLSN